MCIRDRKTTIIRDSRWRCDHGWDIDLDDGSSNYDLYNNLMLSGGLKFREGFRRRAWNNITVNNVFHPHVWYDKSEDEVFSNIFMGSHRGARMPKENAKGKRVDSNLFFSSNSKAKDRHAKYGWDVNSIAADPDFVDPAAGDFSVKEGSPAFDIGFKNFPMDQFGVKKPSLKAIAATPVIPPLNVSGKSNGGASAVAGPSAGRYWLGAKLHELVGEEFSSYGVTKEDGGIALDEVPDGCEAKRLGFKAGDLIQGLNDQKVSNLREWSSALIKAGDAPMKVTVVRDQQTGVRSVSANSYVVVESVSSADGFSALNPTASQQRTVTANHKLKNQSIQSLTDGELAEDYGPVFGNGTTNGAYKIDLGDAKAIAAINSWSYKKGKRGSQKITLYGSKSPTDPGWNITDRSRFQPLGSIDTSSIKSKVFTAASLRATKGESLGTFRWVLWSVSPVTSSGGGENTAFQELGIELQSP